MLDPILSFLGLLLLMESYEDRDSVWRFYCNMRQTFANQPHACWRGIPVAVREMNDERKRVSFD